MRGLAVLTAALAAGLAVAGDPLAGIPPAADAPAGRIDRLIDRLGSGAFRDREAATHDLDAVGAPALGALRRAANAADPETRRRAAELVARISDRLAAARILAATPVEFDYRDRPLDEAVKDLARRTGAPIVLHDPTPNKFRGRKVTVATPGPMPFWEAIELFCRKADLHEWNGVTPLPGVPVAPQPMTMIGQPAFQGRIIIRNGRAVQPAGGPNANQVVLRDGPGAALPSCRTGAVRIRALPAGMAVPNVTVGADEMIVPLQVSAEPKLQWHGVVDLRIDRAVDEQGQAVAATSAVPVIPGDEDELVLMPNGMVMPRPPQRAGPAGVRVRRSDRAGRKLAELAGTLAAQVRVAEPMVTVGDPLKAADQTARGEFGVTLKVGPVSRAADGEVKVSVEAKLPPDIQLAAHAGGGVAGQVQFQAAFGGGVVIGQRVVGAGPQAQPQPL
ncbi:MAG TPA: hypothetical protein VGF55_20765, partial [Gemmataceae bacterium]